MQDTPKLLQNKISWSKWILRWRKSFVNRKLWAVSTYWIFQTEQILSNLAAKGISANLLSTGSKRKRTKQQIEDEKQANFLKEQQIAAKLENYEVLKQQAEIMKEEQDAGKVATNLIS